MDADRFDAVIRRWGDPTRRALFGTWLGGGLAGLFGLAHAEAKKKRKKKKKCKGGTKKCGKKCIPQTSCCTSADCGGGATCQNGTCLCPSGHNDCQGACVPEDACCPACTGGQVCVDETCECPAGQPDCGGACCAPASCIDDACCPTDRICGTVCCAAEQICADPETAVCEEGQGSCPAGANICEDGAPQSVTTIRNAGVSRVPRAQRAADAPSRRRSAGNARLTPRAPICIRTLWGCSARRGAVRIASARRARTTARPPARRRPLRRDAAHLGRPVREEP